MLTAIEIRKIVVVVVVCCWWLLLLLLLLMVRGPPKGIPSTILVIACRTQRRRSVKSSKQVRWSWRRRRWNLRHGSLGLLAATLAFFLGLSGLGWLPIGRRIPALVFVFALDPVSKVHLVLVSLRLSILLVALALGIVSSKPDRIDLVVKSLAHRVDLLFRKCRVA